MNQAPIDFSLELYQDLVSDAMQERIRLLLVDDVQLLLPKLSDLSEGEQRRLGSIFAGDPAAAAPCIAQMMDPQAAAGLRLVALANDSERGRREPFAAQLHQVMAGVCQCVSQIWSLSSELDGMTDELTARYEELHLLYRIDRHDNIDHTDDAEVLDKLLKDTAAHLQVPALLVFAPDDGLEILVRPAANELAGDGVETDQARVLQSLGPTLRALARTHEGVLVLNRNDDPRRDDVLRAVDARIMAAPLTVGGSSNGVVAVLRPPTGAEFRSHDSKLINVVAEQLALMFRGSRDELTGLLNRRGFEQRLTSFIDSDAGSSGLLLYLDLHNFRVLNETCGRVAGDELLRETAQLLVAATRAQDLVARIGSDEFAILIGHCEPALATDIANNFLARLQQHEFVWAGRTQEFGAGVGAVPLALCSGDAPQLLSVAEAACGQAIENGANSLHVYSAADESLFEQRGRVQWVPKLKEALREERFELHAQAIVPVDAAAGLRDHYELLVRLRDHDGELIGPNEFIPAAERFQLMSELDRWVVRHALSTLSSTRWMRAASQVVWSINLSGQSLSDERFHTFLLEEFEQHDFPYQNLCFEVTETAAVANHRAAIALITTLKSRGVSFALDDFGTGLSSFAYLQNLPVSMLKIDGSFVRGLVADPFSRATVDAVNRVGKAMGLHTVAEYVENDAILEVLRELGVDYAQGFGVGRPTDLHAVLTRLQEGLALSKAPRSAQVIDLVRKRSAHE